MGTLDHSKVETMLQGYESSKVTDELYDMGKVLLEECSTRVEYLDSKAGRIAGYSGAIIGLMVSTFPIWTSAADKWAIGFVALGSLVGLIGGGVALSSTSPKTFLLPSDTDWLEEDGLNDPDRLKRYYVSSLHVSITSHEEINARKISKIKVAQKCLAVMVFCLLIGLGNQTYRFMRHSSQPSSGHAASAAPYDHGSAAVLAWQD